MCDRFDRARFEKGKGKFSMNSTETSSRKGQDSERLK